MIRVPCECNLGRDKTNKSGTLRAQSQLSPHLHHASFRRTPPSRSSFHAPTYVSLTLLMSRPTTSQIIAKGEYLQPSFDPKSLTIPHLIGIFAYHGVAFPAQHNKAKLVEIFNENIKKNAPNLMKQRLERQETMASEDGILDGVTGNPIVSTFTGP